MMDKNTKIAEEITELFKKNNIKNEDTLGILSGLFFIYCYRLNMPENAMAFLSKGFDSGYRKFFKVMELAKSNKISDD